MISILLYIESKGKVKAKELAEKLETSVRTIYRDVDALCEAGIPLMSETGPNGGIQLMEGYSVNLKDLNEQDLINLYLSSMGINPGKQSDMSIKVNTALLKLQKNLSKEFNEDFNTKRQRFFIDDIPWWGQKRALDILDIYMQAVWQSHKLGIEYKKPAGETSNRIIRPYGIVVNEMDWYVVAYCERSNDIRTFKCERIIKCQVLFETFDIPKEFSLEQYWKKSKESFKQERNSEEKYPVVLRMDKERLDVLKGFQIYEVQEVDNFLHVTINLYKLEYAKDMIFSVIQHAEVLYPIELRTYVASKLHEITGKYEVVN